MTSQPKFNVSISIRCAVALLGFAACAILSLVVLVFPPPTAANSAQVTNASPLVPVIHVSGLDTDRRATAVEELRVLGEIAPQFSDLKFHTYQGFVIQSGSGRGPLGLVLYSGNSHRSELVEALSDQGNGAAIGIVVRFRSDLSTTAGIAMRATAPGRPVFVLEPVPKISADLPQRRSYVLPGILAGLSGLCALLFVLFRRAEVQSHTNRPKQPGEDRPWRGGRLPSSWAAQTPPTKLPNKQQPDRTHDQ